MMMLALCSTCKSLYETGGYALIQTAEGHNITCAHCKKNKYTTYYRIEKQHRTPTQNDENSRA